MPIHERVLAAALRLCRERGGWTFRPGEIVEALPDLNAASVRTHVMSRCCSNAPAHHPHRWPYFRRLRRGVYEIRREWREGRRDAASASTSKRRGDAREPGDSTSGLSPGWVEAVAEASRDYGAQAGSGKLSRPSAGVVVEVRETAGEYRAVIPGKSDAIRSTSLDATVQGIRNALRESTPAPTLSSYGGAALRPSETIRVILDLEEERTDPVLAAYAKDVDRTLVRENLKKSFEERLIALQNWANAMEEIRGIAWRQSKERKP